MIIDLADYGARPDSGADATVALQEALAAAAKINGPVTLIMHAGQYDLFRDKAARQLYYITNTASEEENPDPTKTIAVWLKGLKNLTIDGQGAVLMLHGQMTGFVMDGCRDIVMTNLHFDMADPTVVELRVAAKTSNSLVIEMLPGTQYTLENGMLDFVGDGWTLNCGNSGQAYDPVRDVTWRCGSPFGGAIVKELAPGRIELTYAGAPDAEAGWHYQLRDNIRSQAGGFINESQNITLKNVAMNFMHGFGIVGQYSENLTFDGMVFEPAAASERTNAGFADFLQIMGCRGKVLVKDCRFNGSQDDPINVHGTHLRVISQPASNQVLVRFMHPQSYGFQAFFPGDEIDFVHRDTLRAFATRHVAASEMKSPREILLTLDQSVPESVRLNEDVVENATWTPEVEIRDSYFGRTPTRGILITTRRKSVIENNIFFRTTMSAIDVADDAGSWFESGVVRDLTIRGNKFIECAEPVITVNPNGGGSGADFFIHSNIRVLDNEFTLKSASVAVSVYAAKDFVCTGNQFIEGLEPVAVEPLVRLNQCPDAVVRDNVRVPGTPA